MTLGQQRGEMNNDGTQMKHLAIQEGQVTDAEPGADGAHLKHLAKQEGQESGPEPGAEGGRKAEQHERKANQVQDEGRTERPERPKYIYRGRRREISEIKFRTCVKG